MTVRRITAWAVAAGAAWVFAGLVASGQSAPEQKGLVIDTGAFTPFVENMDRSLAFYHDVFDMEVPPLPATGMRPYNPPNPGLFAFFDIPGAKERHQSARVDRHPHRRRGDGDPAGRAQDGAAAHPGSRQRHAGPDGARHERHARARHPGRLPRRHDGRRAGGARRRHPRGDRPRRGQPLHRAPAAAVDSRLRTGPQHRRHPPHADGGRPAADHAGVSRRLRVHGRRRADGVRPRPSDAAVERASRRLRRAGPAPKRGTRSCGWSSSSSRASSAGR